MPYVFSPEVRTGPEGEDVVWRRGATPTEAAPPAPYQDKRAPLAVVPPAVDWCEVLRLQSALFTCRQEQAAGCIVLLQVFHAWLLLPNALQPSAHPLFLSHLACPRLNRDEPGRTALFGLFISGTQQRHADKDPLSPVHVRLDLQLWTQCAHLLWRIPHLPLTSAFSHWRTSSSKCA